MITLDRSTWVLIALFASAGVYLLYATFFYTPQPAAPASNPLIGFYPGEHIDVDPDMNASCLNQVMPQGLTADLVRVEEYRDRINFTHVEVGYEQYVLIQRKGRQSGKQPDELFIHEETLYGCDTLDRERYREKVVYDLYGTSNQCTVIVPKDSGFDTDGITGCNTIYEDEGDTDR